MTDTAAPDPALVAGLRPALAGPLPLQAKGNKSAATGMFDGKAAGKKYAAEAVRLGLVEEFTEQQTTTTATGGKSKKTKTVTLARLTPAGRQFVIDSDTPKAVLEALLPADQNLGTPSPAHDLDGFQKTVADAATACVAAIREAFDGLQQKVVAALPKPAPATDPGPILDALRSAIEKANAQKQEATSPPPPPPPAAGTDAKVLGDEIVALVERSARERSVGCDFGELYDALERTHPALTIGTFHDTLRALDHANRIRLSGWAGMLDDMPRPELALFVSHKVMCYAQPAR